jgi:hypothetical protein
MTHVLRRRSLSRRTFLRGAGTAIALPWLDAMRPVRAAPPAPLARAVFVFAPNGQRMDRWTPSGSGPELVLPEILAPLAPLRDRLVVVTGLALDGARAHGDGPGDHARAAAAFLTCTHPRKTAGPDLQAGVSIDQVLAAHVGRDTRFPSLELGLEGGRRSGACDSGYACAYSNHVSWRDPATPLPKETDPRGVFERLFGPLGDPLEEDLAARAVHRRRSVLDAVLADARSLARSLGPADRHKLDQFLTAVREVERRLGQSDAVPAAAPPAALVGRVSGFPQRLELQYELLALALASGATRVATLMLGNAGSNRSYPFLGVRDGHHSLSHHRGDAAKIDQIGRINVFHIERLAAFLLRLRGLVEGESTLLDRTAVVYGSGISDGDRHRHDDLPILVAGGSFAGDRHVVRTRETPLANLYVALLDRFGVPHAGFGDSDGVLDL